MYLKSNHLEIPSAKFDPFQKKKTDKSNKNTIYNKVYLFYTKQPMNSFFYKINYSQKFYNDSLLYNSR